MEPISDAIRLAGGMVYALGAEHVSVVADEPQLPQSDKYASRPPTERQALYQNNKDVAVVCAQNSISMSVFAGKPASLTALEMCFYNLDRIAGFKHFPNLRSLCIMTQDLDKIEGLSECPLLEKLWICETNVAAIEGLQLCTELKELYLYSNQLQRIEGLNSCTKLEKLWLSDNDISIIENLHPLIQLRELHIGNNRIASVGDALDGNMCLENLNISGNLISSFREVLFLARLPQLSALCLSDANFADNPICSLCNYQTHVIYHLPNLKSLDTLDVTDESRRIISATVLKKRMYYNMRIRTIKRNTNFLLKLLATRAAVEIDRVEGEIQVLMQRTKRVKKRRDDLILTKEARGKHLPVDLMTKLAGANTRLQHFIQNKSRLVRELQAHREEVTLQISQQSDMAIRKLLLELETGGNVRFEDEQRDDAWFASCEVLVKKLLTRAKALNSGKNIRVHRISRVHNRYLRNTYEASLAALPSFASSTKGGGKGGSSTAVDAERAIDHLWYQGARDDFEDVFSVVEYGFCEETDDGGIADTVLPNFLECAGPPQDEMEVRLGIPPRNTTPSAKRLQQALVVKAPTGYAVKIDEVPVNLPPAPRRRSAVASSAKLPPRAEDAPKRFAFADTRILLPEYFVEYSLDNPSAHLMSRLEQFLIDLAFSNKLSQAGMPAMVSEFLKQDHVSQTPVHSELVDLPLAIIESRFPEVTIGDDTSGFLDYTFKHTVTSDATPVVDFLNLSSVKIKSLSEQTFFAQIKSLSLSGCGLSSIGSLSEFPQLEALDLSFNKITHLHTLRIAATLRSLDIAGNAIVRREEFDTVIQMGQSLSELDTRFNPICKSKGYRSYLSTRLPGLRQLDGVAYRAGSANPQSRIDLPLLIEHSSTQPHLFRPLSVRTQTGYGFSATQNEYWRLAHHPHINEALMIEALTTLELDSCNLFDLQNVPAGMVNLRWASFRNNSIRDVSPLAQFSRLEELALENNEIETIEPLTALKSLAKLDVSLNRITSIDCARGFQSLMLFSMENNNVDTLKPLAELPTLMELYCGNNEVNDLLSIFPLRDLPRLIILDFTGNAVCQLESYRLFTIYHLARLKILDGTGISAKEQAAAREAYLGKLTIELLGEKIGHQTFKVISELDLRNCKIREIDCFTGLDFRNLRKLTFDNNLLTSIDCFIGLAGLRSLSLNNNKIERLLLSDAPTIGSASTSAANLRNDSTAPEGRRISTKGLLPSLEELHLGHNMITRIADLGLHRLPQLRTLYLHGNRIGKIDGLDQLKNLTELVLDKNHIKGADPGSFSSLEKLRDLHIKENRIKSLANFETLQGLQRLYMSHNRVHEISEIEKTRLPNLVELSLAANAVARKQMYRWAVMMRFPLIMGIDGTEVIEEDRQRAQMFYLERSAAQGDMNPMIKLVAPTTQLLPSQINGGAKLPIKISSVVLDGLEMKLGANPVGFLSLRQ
ncbi:Leucine-rich repeat-containing protein 9 [Geranomyces variabilis]|nr:Leucine-rich repeat-containing protein 9 [Geranomyces variabilis]